LSDVLRYEASKGIATLLLNRPDKRNALSAELIAAIVDAVGRAAADSTVRVIALRGAGADFCAGADLAELAKVQQLGPEESLADAQRLGDLLIRFRRCPKPLVAVVHGKALAGGAGLATACDLVLAREDAELGYPEVHLGFVPAMVMAILRRKVPEGRAFELVARGDRIGAAEAERIGLVNRVFPTASFDADVASYLTSLA
jgi:methylglutaconyl-CoA hydratase